MIKFIKNLFKPEEKRTEFHFGERVVITKGFYKGKKGTVKDKLPEGYVVDLGYFSDLCVCVTLSEVPVDDMELN